MTENITQRVGIVICLALVAIVAIMQRGLVGTFVGQGLSMLLVAGGFAWSLAGSRRVRRVAELYLWLAFILAIYYLQAIADGVAQQTGLGSIDVFRIIAVGHVASVAAAAWALGALCRTQGTEPGSAMPVRLAAWFFIVGAVIFWVGARTFPGLSLQSVHANMAGHLWTSINFLVATVVTLAGLAMLTRVLRDAGDNYLSLLGLLFFAVGAVFWCLHLAFRMTILVQAASEWHLTSTIPQWFEPWRQWAAVLFVLYSVMAYIALAAYGGAFLKTGRLPRWIGWTCSLAGLVAAPLGGLPLFIHVPLWVVGIVLLTREAPAAVRYNAAA